MTGPQTRFLSVLTDHFGVIQTTEATILDAVFLRDLKPDSLDNVEFAMALEEAFHIEITDDEMADLPTSATLHDLLALVERKLGVSA